MKELDIYVYVITALLPLVACLVVLQVNPYHALIVRGILGAVAALVYAILGAGDVALTEALVGTLLAITLYAVAVRSSLVMRLGVLVVGETEENSHFNHLLNDLRTIFSKRQMRLELVSYEDTQALEQALLTKEVHTICSPQTRMNGELQSYQTTTRIQRLYDIMDAELASSRTILTYVKAPENTPKEEKKHEMA
jgi:putative multicomponent Na+:H+ antiporter subunit B